jgi:hypothetical protein
MNLIRKWLETKAEEMGLIRPKLVAVVDYTHEWVDEDDDLCDAVITYYLQEFPSGNRTFKFSASDGYEEFLLGKFSRDVNIWCYGGPLPKGADTFSAKPVVIEFKKMQPET